MFRPPESKVMPLPTRATEALAFGGCQVRVTMRGGLTEPWPTPTMPPKPPFASAFSSRTLMVTLARGGGVAGLDRLGEGLREELVRGSVDQVAGVGLGVGEDRRAGGGGLDGLDARVGGGHGDRGDALGGLGRRDRAPRHTGRRRARRPRRPRRRTRHRSSGRATTTLVASLSERVAAPAARRSTSWSKDGGAGGALAEAGEDDARGGHAGHGREGEHLVGGAGRLQRGELGGDVGGGSPRAGRGRRRGPLAVGRRPWRGRGRRP